MKKNYWGFDVHDRDTSVRPQDDFHRYASGTWLDRHPIPANESRWGAFNILHVETQKKLRAIVTELEKSRSAKKGSPEQRIRDLYRSALDMKRRNALGLAPVKPFLAEVSKIETVEDVVAFLPELHRIGVSAFFGAAVDQDSKDSTKYILHLFQDGLGMPDRDYYLNTDTESKRVRDAYLPFVVNTFRLIARNSGDGYSIDAKKAAEAVIRVETRLAKYWMRKEDRRDAEKTYHKRTLRELQKLSPALEWKKYLKEMGAQEPKAVIAMQPEYLAAVTVVLRDTPIEDLKAYLAFHGVNEYAGCLSSAFVKNSFAFYGTVLAGAKKMKPLWRQALNAVNGALGEELGRLYVARCFPPEAKREMKRMVADLFEAYEARIRTLGWMSPASKKKALRKLAAMATKIGYPDTWKSYAGLDIRPDDFVGNMVRAEAHEHRRQMRKLGKRVDRGEWFMTPQTVNAYNAPNLNDIAFPAAILQPPFFNLQADDAINYGSIGSVIGHEITHGFDDQGAKFDHEGNLLMWWTKDDKKRFDAKGAIVKKQYDRYQVADGVKVNGKLTLGENIADFGGLAIAYDAYQRRLARTGRKEVEGLTPEQRFFLGFALFERENTRPEFQKMAALNDPHSPSKFRTNGPLSNFEPFYEAFGLKKGDKLYREPKDRVRIW